MTRAAVQIEHTMARKTYGFLVGGLWSMERWRFRVLIRLPKSCSITIVTKYTHCAPLTALDCSASDSPAYYWE